MDKFTFELSLLRLWLLMSTIGFLASIRLVLDNKAVGCILVSGFFVGIVGFTILCRRARLKDKKDGV
jgi:hypothetical protein